MESVGIFNLVWRESETKNFLEVSWKELYNLVLIIGKIGMSLKEKLYSNQNKYAFIIHLLLETLYSIYVEKWECTETLKVTLQ